MNPTLSASPLEGASLDSVPVHHGAPPQPQTTDVGARVESTLEQLDALWAELDRGDFELNIDGVKSDAPALEPSIASSQSATRLQAQRAKLRAKAIERSKAKVTALTDCKVSVVIPVYNEHTTVLHVIEQVQKLPLSTEIIVVDDCSTDGTQKSLETLRDMPGLRLILKQKNEGKGAALRTGFAAATGDIIIVQDADLEYDPRDIPAVIQPIVAGYADVSYGSRYLKGQGRDSSRLHRCGNWLLTSCANWINGVRLTDMETCYKAFRRSVVRDIAWKQDRFGFEPEITAKVVRRRYRLQEVPIRYNPRGYAEGKKIGVRDLFNTLYCIVRYGLAD